MDFIHFMLWNPLTLPIGILLLIVIVGLLIRPMFSSNSKKDDDQGEGDDKGN